MEKSHLSAMISKGKESIRELGKRFKKENEAKEIVDKFALKETETKNAVKDMYT